MNSLLRELHHRIARLNQAKEFCMKHLDGAPEGRLRVDLSRGKARYYVNTTPSSAYRYIRPDKMELVPKLAQKTYCEKVIRKIESEIRAIEELCSHLEKNSADAVYSSLSPTRQTLVKPALLDDDLYVRRWLEQNSESNPYHPEGKTYKTHQGQLVRSKTELMQANVYDELGIPYLYESKLVLKDGSVYYPDFTTLHIPTRTNIYHEHLGLLDDPEYRKQAMLKLEAYKRNGIFVGKNLLLTMESNASPFNLELFRSTIREIFWCD